MLNLLSRILYLTFLILVIIGISKLYLPLSENDYERILNLRAQVVQPDDIKRLLVINGVAFANTSTKDSLASAEVSSPQREHSNSLVAFDLCKGAANPM